MRRARRVGPSNMNLMGVMLAALVSAFVTALASACTETPLGGDPGTAPGATTETVELIVPIEEFDLWRDTTVTGFATANAGGFVIAAEQDSLRSRALGRFELPDTFRTDTDTLPPEAFEAVSLRLHVDSALSIVSDEVTIRMYALTRSFDEIAVDWLEASPGIPWTTPGGDIGPQIASVVVPWPVDTIHMEFEVDPDSLLLSWVGDGEPGFAISVDEPGSSLRITSVRMTYDVLLEGRQLPIRQSRLADARSFITDPPIPETGTNLRIGGLPASRFYFEWMPPDSFDGVPVRGSAVNHAELRFTPLSRPAAPYGLDRSLIIRPTELLGDPFKLGEKTPIGAPSSQVFELKPPGLTIGEELRINVTGLMDQQVVLPPDSFVVIRMGMRPDPDAQELGYWEFGSAESPPEFRPYLLLVVTPRPEFRFP